MTATHVLPSLLLLVGSCAGGYDNGYEYKYLETGLQNSGTMDHRPAAAGISWRAQVLIRFRNKKAYVDVSDLHYSQYVGAYPTDHSAWEGTQFGDQKVGKISYVISYDNEGKIKGIELPRDASEQMKNQIRAQAQMFQWDSDITQGYMERTEKLLHGDCKVQYTINDVMVQRSVNHFANCKDRPYRHVDDWRGWRCDSQWAEQAHEFGKVWTGGRNDPDPISSKTDFYYIMENRDGKKVVKEMGSESGIGTRFWGQEGASKFVYTRRNLKLQEVKPISGQVYPSGLQKYNDLTFKMVNNYKWNEDRDLKASEEFLDGGFIHTADQNTYIQGLVSALDGLYNNFDLHDAGEENAKKLHQYGVETPLMYMFTMDYNSLQSVFDRLDGDSSEAGVSKKKMFLEYLPSTGTSASALFLIDCIQKGKCFDDGQSAGRAVLGIPYHIRRPSKQLVMELEKLTTMSNLDEAIKIALPLTLGHLARRTCELAGKDFVDPEFHTCVSQLIDPYSERYFEKFQSAKNDEEKTENLAVLRNLRWGKISDLLKDYIYGYNSDPVQSDAVIAAMYSTFIKQNTASYFLPVVTNPLIGTETRIIALLSFLYGKFDLTQLSTVVNSIYASKDSEFTNFAYSAFDTFSNTLNPCYKDKKDMISYFYRYMKQVGAHSVNYGFGISKMYVQEFESEKFENTGGNYIMMVGSSQSVAPLKIVVGVTHSKYQGYAGEVLSLELRLEGLSRALIKQFRKMKERDWKLSDLENFLKSMNVDLKPEQPVRVGATVSLKGSVILRKVYYSKPDEASKNIMKLLNDLRGKGGKNTYRINHQRALTYGLELYEQPSEAGIPVFYVNSMTTMMHIEAQVNKGISKGVLFRDLDFDVHLVTNAYDGLSFVHGKQTFDIYQQRAYSLHVPRHLIIGVNIVKKEINIQAKRPAHDNPVFLMIHAQTLVATRAVAGGSSKLSSFCASCSEKYQISSNNPVSKEISNDDNSEFGYKLLAEYFDCEADLSDANVGGNAVFAFHPQNKNPQTFMTSFLMGLRQARTYVMFYPQIEKCGAYMKWSQSTQNPVDEIKISVQVKYDTEGEKYYYEGNKVLIKSAAEVSSAQGKRTHKLNVKLKSDPGSIASELSAQYVREPSAQNPEYTICFNYKSQYPSLPDTFQSTDLDAQLEYTALLQMKYGETKACSTAKGKIMSTIKHTTTEEATNQLKKKSYYKECMKQKASSVWKQRSGLPLTGECWLSKYDATNARKYSWDILFDGVSPEVRAYFEKGETVLKTAILPYWDLDPKALQRSLDEKPKLKLDILFKNADKLVDVKLETEKGVSNFEDMPVNFPVVFGPLTNLREEWLPTTLVQNNVIDWCMLDKESMRMLDNNTIPFTLDPCWTLISSHCGPTPTFAVLAKKNNILPFEVQIYLGGHKVEMKPTSTNSISVKINGRPFNVAEGETKPFKSKSSDICKISNWGGTYIVQSLQTATVNYDGNFIQVVPNPTTKGQHCGACGNFDGNKFNNLIDKQGQPVSLQDLPSKWCQ